MNPWELPAVVLVLVTWLNAPSLSLGDLAKREALRRQMTPPSAHSLVTDNLPPGALAPVSVPVSTSSSDDEAKPAGAKGAADDAKQGDEKFWRDRMSSARQALDRDRLLLEAMQGRINSLTTDFVNRDDPAARAQVEANRQKALAEFDRLKKQITTDEQTISDIQTEARQKGVPPGWIR
jgi:hypothetical protein